MQYAPPRQSKQKCNEKMVVWNYTLLPNIKLLKLSLCSIDILVTLGLF